MGAVLITLFKSKNKKTVYKKGWEKEVEESSEDHITRQKIRPRTTLHSSSAAKNNFQENNNNNHHRHHHHLHFSKKDVIQREREREREQSRNNVN